MDTDMDMDIDLVPPGPPPPPPHSPPGPQRLPTELILLIVEALAPDNPNAILPPNDLTTRTILACTQVCRATYYTATRVLRRHCMFIDCNQRARQFARCLRHSPPPFLAGDPQAGTGLRSLTSLFLRPYTEERDEVDESDSELNEDDCSMISDEPEEEEEIFEPLDEDMDVDSNASDSGSSWEWLPSPLEDLKTTRSVRFILFLTAPTLKRLIIDMPLRSLYPEEDICKMRPRIRKGFTVLENLEEFVSVRDELFLCIQPQVPRREEDVWATCWPKLRRLALYNPILDPDRRYWDNMARLPDFEMGVFLRADSNNANNLDVKKSWFKALARTSGMHFDDVCQNPRPLTIVHVNCACEQATWSKFVRGWRRVDPEHKVRALLKDLPDPVEADTSSVHSDDSDESDWPLEPREICQEWVMTLALEGKLWEEATQARDPLLG